MSEETQEKFNRGHIIGDLAQKLFPQGQDPFYPYSRKTKAHFEPEISAIFNKKSSFSLTFKENIGQKHRFIFLELMFFIPLQKNKSIFLWIISLVVRRRFGS